ncbi:MAG: hypothetical protein CSA40_01750 [Flavobacteriales bacterium]|nr:MAG: hypothetical protein CSA40_01750 [Flavobacteriales bacterium]
MNFFKYTSIPTALIVLKNKSLRWSSPKLFNDIEECQFTPFTKDEITKSHKEYISILEWYSKGLKLTYDEKKFSQMTNTLIQLLHAFKMKGGTKDDFLKIILAQTENFEEDYRNFINTAVIKSARILCVTKDCTNKLMWAHYGDENKGCVIEFEKLFDKKPKSLKQGMIRYHENLKPKSKPLDYLLYGSTKEIHDKMIEDIFFSKRTTWDYEKEYRLMFMEDFGNMSVKVNLQTNEKKYKVSNEPQKDYTDVSFDQNSVKSITFGARTKDEDIEKIYNIINEKKYNCKFFKIKLKNGKLIPEELNIRT